MTDVSCLFQAVIEQVVDVDDPQSPSMRLSACSEQHKFCSVGFGEDLRRIVGFFFVGDSRPAEDVPRLSTEENNSTGEPMFAACQRTNGFLVNLNQHRDREVEDYLSRSFMSPSNIDITLIKEGNHEEPGWTRFSTPLVCCAKRLYVGWCFG